MITKHLVTIDGHPTLVDAEYDTTNNCSVKNLIIRNSEGLDITDLIQTKSIANIKANAKKQCIENTESLQGDKYNSAFLSLDDELPLSHSTDVYRTGKLRIGALGTLEELIHALDVLGSIRIEETQLPSPSKVFVSAGDGVIKTFDFADLMLKSVYDTDDNGNVDGSDGESAYEIWIGAGNTGDVQAYLDSLVGEQGAQGIQGIQGEQGIQGVAGNNGADGAQGVKGDKGDQGVQGLPGLDGAQGIKGDKGDKGDPGVDGQDGADGLSAYEVWLSEGNTGVINEYLATLVGDTGADGISAFNVWLGEGNSGSVQDFLDSLVGPKGDKGDGGKNGNNGDSAYQIWLNNGNTGTETDFLDEYESLWEKTDAGYERSKFSRVAVNIDEPLTNFHVGGHMYLSPISASASSSIEIGQGRTANGFAFLDLIGDTHWTDYAFRIIRGNTGQNSRTDLLHRGTGTFRFRAIEAANIDFWTNNAVRMDISSSGVINIGNGAMYLNESQGNANTGADIYMAGNAVIASGNSQYYQADASDNSVGDHIWKKGAKTSGGTNLMILTNTGRLGVGVTTPQYTLDVNGSVRLGASAYNGLLIATYTGELAGIPTQGTDGGIQIQSPLLSKTVWDIRANDPHDGIYFRIPTILSINPVVDKILLALKPSGLVGILTESPTHPLDVNGTSFFRGVLNMDADKAIQWADYGGGWKMQDTTWIRSTGSKHVYINQGIRADGWIQKGANGSQFHVTSAGNVGINKQAPTSKLHIDGGLRVDNDNILMIRNTSAQSMFFRSNVDALNGSNIFFDAAMGGNAIADVAINKVLGNVVFRGWANGGYQSGALIRSTVRSAVTADKFATSLDFYTRSASNAWVLNAILEADGNWKAKSLESEGALIVDGASTLQGTVFALSSSFFSGAFTASAAVNFTGLNGNIAPTKVLTINSNGAVEETPVENINTVGTHVCYVKNAVQDLNTVAWSDFIFNTSSGSLATLSSGAVTITNAGTYMISFTARLTSTGTSVGLECKLYFSGGFTSVPSDFAHITNVNGMDKDAVRVQFTGTFPANTAVAVRFRRHGNATEIVRIADLPFTGGSNSSITVGLENNRLDIVKLS